MKKLFAFATAAISFVFFAASSTSCTSCPRTTAVKDTALNVTVYLDLSDRLMRSMNPSQTERDISIVEHISQIFKKVSLGPQLRNSRNHIKVMFYPTPNSSEIVTIANNLDVDMESIVPQKRKAALDTLTNRFNTNLKLVYSQTIKDKNWLGSDIWGFFDKKIVDQQCIKKDSRNILVIITDGYIFDKNNKQKQGNSYNYILPQNLNVMDSVIVSRKGLENLEVLMLEVNPSEPTQRAKMISLLENWFKNMGIQRFSVADTDLPTNVNTVIDNFFNQK